MSFLRRHRVVCGLLVAGFTVRLLTVIAYWPAFWFQTDSKSYILRTHLLRPGGGEANPFGYPAFLRLFEWTGSLALVAIVQHLIGLGLAGLLYAMLRRRGLPGWLAALGAAPLLLDAHQIVLEHYILSDSVFTALVVGAAVALLWHERPTPVLCAVAGGLLFASILVRTAGATLVGLVLVYLVIRRIGWVRAATFACAGLIPLALFLMWTKDLTGHYRIGGSTERYLYSRTAGIADCDHLRISDLQRRLCPAQPLGERPMRGDHYLWNDQEHLLAGFTRKQDPVIGGFAKAVITQQPGDYAALVATDTARYLVPGLGIDAETECLFGWWRFPADLTDSAPNTQRCKPLLAQRSGFLAPPARTDVNDHAGLRSVLAWYSRWITVPPLAQGIVVLGVIAALAYRRRVPGLRYAIDAAMVATAGLVLLVLAVATSMYEIRYGLTATVLFGLAGVLATHRLLVCGRWRDPSLTTGRPWKTTST